MSDTFFTAPPHWQWLVILYFFFGGLAGGSYLIAVLGGLGAFFLAGYTGVLLAVTNRPVWSDTPLLGLLFLVSANSIAAAALILLGRWQGVGSSSMARLARMDRWLIVLELLVL